MILLLRAAQAPMGSIELHAVGLELAPAELGVLAEVPSVVLSSPIVRTYRGKRGLHLALWLATGTHAG